ncbi:hypothetical protein BVRB_4g079010 [Beta vulgaris subsp. vulgaris]|nr:hypothetical protein BVRB_4g079010 [Beta vulgaris subsp. vulgaris]
MTLFAAFRPVKAISNSSIRDEYMHRPNKLEFSTSEPKQENLTPNFTFTDEIIDDGIWGSSEKGCPRLRNGI